jgi:hypothetical protein
MMSKIKIILILKEILVYSTFLTVGTAFLYVAITYELHRGVCFLGGIIFVILHSAIYIATENWRDR